MLGCKQLIMNLRKILFLTFCFTHQLSAQTDTMTHTMPKTTEVEKAATALGTEGLFTTLFQEDIIQLHLTTDFKQLIKRKSKEERFVGALTITDHTGNTQDWDIEVRTRGNQRKKICYFPPLKIYFPKSALTERGYHKKFNDYKLVLKCRRGETYNDFVLKEYLVYKLYSLLTDISFRVQLVQLTITDENNARKPLNTYGYIIENEDEMAARLAGRIIDQKILSPKTVDADLYDRMCLFQFMIGNTDWYAYINHNMKILGLESLPKPVLIPYDFDYSGIVSTNYATPNNNYPLEDIKDRYFLGMCRPTKVYAKHLAFFKSKKEALLAYPATLSVLPQSAKDNMRQYLVDFFRIIENPKMTKSLILDHCGLSVKIK